MMTTLASKGQVTIPERIRDELQLLSGVPVQFSVNTAGEVVVHWPRPAKGLCRPKPDRFEAPPFSGWSRSASPAAFVPRPRPRPSRCGCGGS